MVSLSVPYPLSRVCKVVCEDDNDGGEFRFCVKSVADVCDCSAYGLLFCKVVGDVDTAWDEDFILCFVWIVDDCPEPALTVALNADP